MALTLHTTGAMVGVNWTRLKKEVDWHGRMAPASLWGVPLPKELRVREYGSLGGRAGHYYRWSAVQKKHNARWGTGYFFTNHYAAFDRDTQPDDEVRMLIALTRIEA